MKLGTIWNAWRNAEHDETIFRNAWMDSIKYDYDNIDQHNLLHKLYKKRERQRLRFVDHIIDHIAEYDANAS
jgi:hypothetical protein